MENMQDLDMNDDTITLDKSIVHINKDTPIYPKITPDEQI